MAQIALKIAREKVSKNFPENKDFPLPCPNCGGNGNIVVTSSTYEKKNSERTIEMDCRACAKTGRLNKQQYFQSRVHDELWCRCQEDYESLYVFDGYDVFGTDTYICKFCQLVTQFG